MPRSPRYVILDIDELNGGSVTAVYGPFTERGAAKWLRREYRHRSARNPDALIDYLAGISIIVRDGRGKARELKIVPVDGGLRY